jgi:hypothetical protein
MHQTMTANDNKDRGTINRINRQPHPPPRKSGFIESETGLTMGNEMCPRFLAMNIILAYTIFRG